MQLFERLDRGEFEPFLYLLRDHGELVERVRALGVPVASGGVDGSLLSPAIVPCIARFARLFRHQRLDVVHTFLPRGEFVGSVAARIAGVPVLICSKRGCHHRRGAEAIAARISNHLADRVLVNARAVGEFVVTDESCPKEKIAVIENGIDIARFRPVEESSPFKARLGLAPDRPVVGTVTRARVRKGYEEFLRAAAQVRQHRPDLQVVVVGQDTREQAPRELVERLGLGPALHLLGLRTDIPDVLAAMDIFVLSSHDEGMSNAVLEAMAAGKAIVATEVGGTPEMIRSGETGLLVPPRQVGPLADAIASLLDNRDRAAEMGKRARRVAEEKFSLDIMVRRNESLYRDLCAAKARWPAARVREESPRT